MSSPLRIVAATALFALVHSALASRTVKTGVARRVGQRRVDAFYRPFYVAQSIVTSGALLAYGSTLPRRTVYRLRGPAAWLVRGGQLVAVLELARGIRTVGLARLVGADNLPALLRGDPVPPAPVTQGPERDPRTEGLRFGGPFRRSRHPLNFWAVPLFWCTPHLTTRRLAFNLAATAYLALGSRHEEARLVAAYGEDYLRYAVSGPAFFVPRFVDRKARKGVAISAEARSMSSRL
jgi:hypothetical protein